MTFAHNHSLGRSKVSARLVKRVNRHQETCQVGVMGSSYRMERYLTTVEHIVGCLVTAAVCQAAFKKDGTFQNCPLCYTTKYTTFWSLILRFHCGLRERAEETRMIEKTTG